MKRFIPQQVSRDYVKLVIAVVVVVSLLSSFFIFTTQKNNKAMLYGSVEQRALHLDSALVGSFNYIIYLMDFLSRQISANGSSLEYVQSLYHGFEDDLKVKNLSSWSMFDWLTPDKNIRVTSTNGILDHPVSLADRPNLKEADKNPDLVFFNDPSLGKISQQWIIPVSKAVNNKEGERLGYINIGVIISGVLSNFEHYDDNITYALFTDKFIQIRNDSDPLIEEKLVDDFKKQIKGATGILEHPLIMGDTKYVYYYKSPKYPFIFLLGYNDEVQKYIFLKNLLLPVAIFLVLGIIAVISSYMLYYRVILPIASLGKAAKNITEEKEFDVDLKPDLPIEIINLANQLNNINIYKQQLLQAKMEVESANAAKTEFLSATAHELRSPLNAIIGMSEMIKRKMFGDDIEKYAEYAADIEQSGHDLLGFITDLLDVSKSEAGNFTLEKEEWVDVDNIINRSIKLNLTRSRKANIKINKHVDDDFPKLYADSRRIRQILVNLISNSIKYSQQDTVINISAVLRDGKILLIIADQGFGMNEDQILIALKKWGKVENNNIGVHGDSFGLGLPIAKHLAELHGAEFMIDSEPNRGTTITIAFPKERVAS